MLAANDDSFEIARLLLEYTIEIDAQDHVRGAPVGLR